MRKAKRDRLGGSPAGWTRVLIKVANLDGGWAFQLRAADPEGVLHWSATPRR